MVIGKFFDGAGELEHLFQEPGSAGLTEGFDIAERLRNTPRGGTSAARFLGDCQCDAFIESSGKQSHLPGKGTTRHRKVMTINWKVFLNQLKAINDSTDSPGPGAVGADMRQFRVEPIDRLVSAFLLVGHHLIEVEGDRRNSPTAEDVARQTSASATEADANDGREWPVAFRKLYTGSQG